MASMKTLYAGNGGRERDDHASPHDPTLHKRALQATDKNETPNTFEQQHMND